MSLFTLHYEIVGTIRNIQYLISHSKHKLDLVSEQLVPIIPLVLSAWYVLIIEGLLFMADQIIKELIASPIAVSWGAVYTSNFQQ